MLYSVTSKFYYLRLAVVTDSLTLKGPIVW